MARKRKAQRRRSPKTTSLLNLTESYLYASVLTEGAMGTTPVGFVTGKADLVTKPTFMPLTYTTEMVQSGGEAISLRDIISEPDQAFNIIQSNVMANYVPMIAKSVGIRIGFKLGKKLLRAPISNVNRTIFKQLGVGVRL